MAHRLRRLCWTLSLVSLSIPAAAAYNATGFARVPRGRYAADFVKRDEPKLNSCQVNIKHGKPYVRFILSSTRDKDTVAWDIPGCMERGASSGSLWLHPYNGDSQVSSKWCQSFFLQELEHAMDDNGRKVFGITLSDIYLRYGLEVKQPAPNPTDPTLFFKPADVAWQSSQQFRFHCQPNDNSANKRLDCWEEDKKLFGKECLIELNGARGTCVTLNGVKVTNSFSYTPCDFSWAKKEQLFDMRSVAAEFLQNDHQYPCPDDKTKNCIMAKPA